MTSPSAKPGQDSRNRAKAVQQALALEEKKTLKSRILDLVLEAYDLPSEPIASPDKASLSDVQCFRNCLSLFQPSDFDDLVRERNIDDRCGYALCSKANKKVARGGNKVWNHKTGQDFRVVDRSELEKWCSDKCGARGGFVRAQLSTEPAWLRGSNNEDVRLLDEMPQTDDLAHALRVI
jgi:RNA polymerase II-associated protein 2